MLLLFHAKIFNTQSSDEDIVQNII